MKEKIVTYKYSKTVIQVKCIHIYFLLCQIFHAKKIPMFIRALR